MAAAALLTACVGPAPEAGRDRTGAPVAPGEAPLDGVTVTVGSKDFDEQLLLGHLSRLLLEDAGATVVDALNLGGTDAARAALLRGEVDHYWEYTGTAWISFLGEDEPLDGATAQYEAVRDRDAAEHGLYWLPPAAFNDTYAIAYARDAADELGHPRTLSDLARLAVERPELATLCVESEFSLRDDGLPGVEERYGFRFPDGAVTVLDTGVVYTATADREPCNFGEVFTTDGRVATLDLVPLEDDLGFFPRYDASPVFVEDLYAAHGQVLEELFAPLTAVLDDATVRELNARVSAGDERPEVVARDLLTTSGLLDG